MKVTFIKKVIKSIDQCYRQCPYFGLDGSPKGLPFPSEGTSYYALQDIPCGEIICTHPDAPNSGYIIFPSDYTEGFPKKCPLIK